MKYISSRLTEENSPVIKVDVVKIRNMEPSRDVVLDLHMTTVERHMASAVHRSTTVEQVPEES